MAQLLLPIYWLLCVAATHLPMPPSAEPLLFLDKVVHATMYMGLALLLGRHLTVKGKSRGRVFAMGVVILGFYGIADELTQPYFGRSADPLDWLADVTGTVVGLSLLPLIPARWNRPRDP